MWTRNNIRQLTYLNKLVAEFTYQTQVCQEASEEAVCLSVNVNLTPSAESNTHFCIMASIKMKAAAIAFLQAKSTFEIDREYQSFIRQVKAIRKDIRRLYL